jgi:hypothetical protein
MLQPGGFQGIARAPVHVVAQDDDPGCRSLYEPGKGLELKIFLQKSLKECFVNGQGEIHDRKNGSCSPIARGYDFCSHPFDFLKKSVI